MSSVAHRHVNERKIEKKSERKVERKVEHKSEKKNESKQVVSTVSKFNTAILGFLDALNGICDEKVTELKTQEDKSNDADNLKLIRSKIQEFLSKANAGLVVSKTLLIEKFIENVLPYREKIDDHNEEYFLGNGEESVDDTYDPNNMSKDDMVAVSVDELSQIRGVYPYVSDTDKEYIFKMMSALCDLAGDYLIELAS